MEAAAPAIPAVFMAKLKKFDRNLGLEWMGRTPENGHWCVVDESKIVRRFKVENMGLIEHSYYKVIYDRLFHLKPGQPLNGRVMEEMWRRDKERWGREDWLKKHFDKKMDEEEENKDKKWDEFNAATASELKTIKNFSVVMPGRKEN